MLDADGTALIMDFGISRSMTAATSTATALGAVVGTLEYMAPEQAQGQPVDQRADIYAFGLILYDMLTGRPAPRRAATTRCRKSCRGCSTRRRRCVSSTTAFPMRSSGSSRAASNRPRTSGF